MRRDRSHLRQVIGPDERAALPGATHHERALILLIVLGRSRQVFRWNFGMRSLQAVTPVNNKRPDAAALMKRSCGLPVLDDYRASTPAPKLQVSFTSLRPGRVTPAGQSPLRPAASP